MSIRSKIALALGCVVLSGAAYAADRTKPNRDAQDQRDRGKPDKVKPAQPVDPATGVPADGTVPVGPAAGAPAAPAVVLQQLSCEMFMPVVGMPSAGPRMVSLRNSTPTALPAGTVVWFGPPAATTYSDGITRPSRGTNPNGTPAHMDRYFRLTTEIAAGGIISSNHSPLPTWPGCAAVIGMSSLIPEVAFVE